MLIGVDQESMRRFRGEAKFAMDGSRLVMLRAEKVSDQKIEAEKNNNIRLGKDKKKKLTI